MNRLSLVLVGCAMIGGCATFEQLSAGEVGCPPEEIQVSNSKKSWNVANWAATCRGQKFYCTSHDGDGGTAVSCAPEVGSTPPGS